LGTVFLVGFFWFGGAGALGLGPRVENSQWLLESYSYQQGVPVSNKQCQLAFDNTSIVEATCFSDGYAYQRRATYAYLDADTILIDPLPGSTNLPIYFGGSYDLRFRDNRLLMFSTATGYTLTWLRS
jgi:hypothetical protein